MRKFSSSKTILFYFITLSLTFGFIFVISEFGLARYYYSSEVHDSEMEFDSYLGWKPRVGTHWVKPDHSLLRHPMLVNQHNLRNKEISTSSEKASTRVIVLGDSFTFARAVADDKTFTSRMEMLLNERGPFEVINAGVPGYGTAQEMLLMKQLAHEGIVGDVYVLMVFVNDILDNLRLDYGNLAETSSRPGFVLQENGKLIQKYHPKKEYSSGLAPPQPKPALITVEVVKRKVASFLQSKPTLMRILNNLGVDTAMPRVPGVINGWYHEEVLAAGIPLTKELIREIQAEAQRQHASLLVSLIPSPIQVYSETYDPILKNTFPNNRVLEEYFKDKMRPQKVIGAICQELGISFLDLYPALVTKNDEELYIPLEGHFTEEGHALVARELASSIASSTVLTQLGLK